MKKKLTKKELNQFKKVILKRKEEISADLKQVSEDTLKKSPKDASGDISGYSFHMADAATDTYDREFSFGLASTEREMIHGLDDALKRIEEGAFGICEDCKSSIPKTRLKALPWAQLCIKCQQKREKK